MHTLCRKLTVPTIIMFALIGWSILFVKFVSLF